MSQKQVPAKSTCGDGAALLARRGASRSYRCVAVERHALRGAFLLDGDGPRMSLRSIRG